MKRKINQKRLEDWFAGTLEDSELTNDEIEWLQEAVFNAVAEKVATTPESGDIH